MLKINPYEIICYSRLIDNSLNNALENMNSVQSIYSQINSLPEKYKTLNINIIQELIDRIQQNNQKLTKIVNELEEITGLSRKQLSKINNIAFYEDKILEYYTEKLYDKNISQSDHQKLYNQLNFYYDTSNNEGKLNQFYQRYLFKKSIPTLLSKFDYQRFNLKEENVINDIMYIYDNRGSNTAYNTIKALVNNCPKNYDNYHFSPIRQPKSNDSYDYNHKTINQYETNSEIININGYNYEFNQVLPKDCTNVERLVYDFSKANIINTMRTLPDTYLKLCSMGNSNSIILTTSKDAMNNQGNWGGYYKTSNYFSNNNNMVVIDINRGLEYNDYYTQDILIHELSHKFDDMLKNESIINSLLGNEYYSTTSDNWKEMFQKHQNIIKKLTNYEYKDFPNINEFFGDTAVAYFKKPQELKNQCPDIYDLFSKTLGTEYGYSYNDKIQEILNV